VNGTGGYNFQANGNTFESVNSAGTAGTWTQQAAASGAPVFWTWNLGAHTGQTASTEVNDFLLNTRTITWAAGTIADQRTMRLLGPTLAFASSSTVTRAATLSVAAPIAGSNATITNNMAIEIESGNLYFTGASQSAVVNATGSSSSLRLDCTSGLLLGTSNANAVTIGTSAIAVGIPALANFTSGVTMNWAALASGARQSLTVTPGNHTGQTASTEINNIHFATYTRTWATGAITTQREVRFSAPTYAFAGASTITDAATVAITAAPIAGTNATITRGYPLWIQGGNPRIDSTSANGSVATVLGSVGPAGSNTTVQEWLTIYINSNVRYIPCF
jgi:hypothetical protein